MRYLYLCFLVTLFFAGLAADYAYPQSRTKVIKNKSSDWTILFPQIPGCERIVQPVQRYGKVIEQTAVYEREHYEKLKNNPDYPNYFGCGSITLRLEPSAREKAAKRDFTFTGIIPPYLTSIRGFFALRDGPLCGNDFWRGSTAVYFDSNKVLIVSSYLGADKLAELAETADYESISNFMEKSAR